MTRPTKRTVHLREARKAKRQKLEATNIYPSTTTTVHELESQIHEAHSEGLSESEESDVDISEPEGNISEEGKNEQPLRPKGKGKGIMISAFLTPGGILKVPIHVSNG